MTGFPVTHGFCPETNFPRSPPDFPVSTLCFSLKHSTHENDLLPLLLFLGCIRVKMEILERLGLESDVEFDKHGIRREQVREVKVRIADQKIGRESRTPFLVHGLLSDHSLKHGIADK